MKVHKSKIPKGSLTNHYLPADYADAFECLPIYHFEFTPDDVMIKFWTDFPGWVNALFKLRNFLVKFAGLKGEKDNSITDFENCIRTGSTHSLASVPAKTENETVLLLTDKHLDAYLSVYFENENDYLKVTAITLVHFHNKLGKVYFFFIRPFHSVIVKQMLKRSIKALLESKK